MCGANGFGSESIARFRAGFYARAHILSSEGGPRSGLGVAEGAAPGAVIWCQAGAGRRYANARGLYLTANVSQSKAGG